MKKKVVTEQQPEVDLKEVEAKKVNEEIMKTENEEEEEKEKEKDEVYDLEYNDDIDSISDLLKVNTCDIKNSAQKDKLMKYVCRSIGIVSQTHKYK
jgi:Icc-related predicted phosphoesterase